MLEYSREDAASVSPNRWQFLLESLQDLDNSLAEIGSRLFVVRGKPVKVLPYLFKKWDITRLSFEADYEPYCKSRDAVITGLAKEAGIEVISHFSHTLYDPQAFITSTEGNVPLLFDEFKELALQQGQPEMPLLRVDRKLFGCCVTPVGTDHHQYYGVPTLDDVGFHKSCATCCELYQGGEHEALARMEVSLREVKGFIAFSP